jgi:formamidopyrimidine-DNA glycosylase
MPELPEVELVVRFLRKLLIGRRIRKAELVRPRLAPHSTAEDFALAIADARIDLIDRRGKHILFRFDNDRTLVTHLRMSGRFMLLNAEDEDPRFAHAIFYFENGQRLVFQDQRHFGFMRVARTNDVSDLPEIKKLGPEPLSDTFSEEYFYGSLRTSGRTIKEFLLDQSRVSGLGNIYASEALFLARIHPGKRANMISRPRTARLHQAVRDILMEAIDAGSTLNANPTDSDSAYYRGEYERYWRVYDREGLDCDICDTSIRRVKQAGRSTFYCPGCQKR